MAVLTVFWKSRLTVGLVGGASFRGLKRLFLRVALAGVVSSVVTNSGWGALGGDRELLRFVAEARKENLQRIRSWQGAAGIEHTQYAADGGVEMRVRSRATFAYDREQEATRWEWVVDEYLAADGGRPVDLPHMHRTTAAMRKRDSFYRFEQGVIRKGQVEHTLVIWSPESQHLLNLAGDFDPMWFFTQKGYDIGERLLYEYREAESASLSGDWVKREGDLVLWEIRGQGGFNSFAFDTSQAGNLVRYHGKDSRCEEECQWGYARSADVWLPKAFDCKGWGTRPEGGVYSYTQQVRFLGGDVNIPMSQSDFSVEKLGVRPGTRVTDRIAGIGYVYGDVPLPDSTSGISALQELEEMALVTSTAATSQQPSVTDTPRDGAGGTSGLAPGPAAPPERGSQLPLSKYSGGLLAAFSVIAAVCGVVAVACLVLRQMRERQRGGESEGRND